MRDLAALNQTLEAKIAARTAELEAAVAAQQRLIGDISHEIKSPLARLSMALGLARRSSGSDMPRQLDRMEKEIDSISALGSELLALARLDGSVAPPEFSSVDLAALVDQIIADVTFEKPIRKGDVAYQREVGTATVFGNADLLRRAIENVVRNAVFYTSKGTIVEVTLSRPRAEVLSIVVADHGPGVPAAALEHLFEPFYRVDEARTRETGGTGIGLTICLRVMQVHGGSVRAWNNDPQGLVVTMELPAEPTGRALSTSAG